MKAKDFYNSSAWRTFRKYIIQKHTKDGVCRCSTCKSAYLMPDKRMHLGHWIKVFEGNSTNLATAFDERNVLPQCYRCNRLFGGRPYEMSKALEKLYGFEVLEQLIIKSKNVCKLGKFEMDLIHKEYKSKMSEIL